MSTAFHPGEVAVQRRMGQADIAERVGRSIHAEIPAKAAEFLAEQPMIVIAAADDAGRMWTSLVTGPPGFAHALDARTIAVDALPVAGDPLSAALGNPRRVGMIALQPQTRRRMRVNGSATPAGGGLRVDTDQVYSNCPKYISRRHVEEVRGGGPSNARRGAALDDAQAKWVATADAFFIGSVDTDGNVDASHRGGNPGFLQVLSPTRLRWPDYRGNSMFMTLGNIAVDPRCALLVPDWRTGATLQMSGTAEIIWDAMGPGSQCAVEFTMQEVVELSGVSPLSWGAAELSPANPA